MLAYSIFFPFLSQEKISPDAATKRKILSLRIQCRNEGCPWTDELREKEVGIVHNPDVYMYKLPYQTHCDICPMSYQVASTSGKIELKTRYFLQNIAFFSESR